MAKNFNINNNPCSLLDVQYNLSQKVKNEFVPSLQYLALTRIAVRLWQQSLTIKIQSVYSDNSYELPETYLICNTWFPQVRKEILDNLPSLFLTIYCEDGLKAMVNLIKSRLSVFLSFLEYNKLSFTAEKVKVYLHAIYWTNQGTINYMKTASVLVESKDLSTLEKYILASNCCMKEKLIDLIERLPENIVEVFLESKSFRLPLFWAFHLKDQDEEFYKILSQQETFEGNVNEYLLQRAIEFDNELSVQYIWENFNDQDLEEKITYFINLALALSSTNVLCYLLSQMKRHQQIEELCAEAGYAMLTIANVYRWFDYFYAVAKCVLEFVHKMNFCDALKTILFCWIENAYDRDKCEKLLREFVNTFKCDIDVNFILNSRPFLMVLLELPNDIMKLLLDVRTVQDRRKFLYGNIGMKLGFDLIIDGKLYTFVMFVGEMLKEEEEIIKYKDHFFEKLGFKICVDLFYDYSRDAAADKFLIAFCAKDKIRSFKRALPYKGQGELVGNIFERRSSKDTSVIKLMIDRCLNWCFEGRKSEIMRCKSILFESDNAVYSYCSKKNLKHIDKLRESGETQQIEKFLKWAFSVNHIRKVKGEFSE